MSRLIAGYAPFGTGRLNPFDALYFNSVKLERVEDVDKVDAIILWGGEDISPTLYGEKAGPFMYDRQDRPSQRDWSELQWTKRAAERGVPILGICRGAQLLCAVAGGRLWQHTEDHGFSHEIVTNDGQRMTTSSVHHQMMDPTGTEHEVIATEDREQYVFDSNGVEHKLDKAPEIVYFPKMRGLAIQGHPEFMNPKSEFVQYCLQLVNDLLIKGKA